MEQIVAAFVDPMFERLTAGSRGWASYARLVAKITTDARYNEPVEVCFGQTAKVFLGALRAACPEVPVARLQWSYLFMVGAFVQTIAQTNRIEQLSGGRLRASEYDVACKELRRFIVGGFSV